MNHQSVRNRTIFTAISVSSVIVCSAPDAFAQPNQPGPSANKDTTQPHSSSTPNKTVTNEPGSSQNTEPNKPKSIRAYGFYFRPSFLVGWVARAETLKSTGIPDRELSRSGVAAIGDIAVGLAPTPGLALGAEVMGAIVSAPDQKIDGVKSADTKGNLEVSWFGLFFDAYPNPQYGFHLGASLTYQVSSFDKGGAIDKSQAGFGVMGKIGYDWYIAERWSIGILLGANAGLTSNKVSGAQSEGTLMAYYGGLSVPL